MRASSATARAGGFGVLEHLAGDDDIEALVAERKLTDVGHEPAAAGTGDRARDQPLSDIHADHGAPDRTAAAENGP